MIKMWQNRGIMEQVSPNSNWEQANWERGEEGEIFLKGGKEEQEREREGGR